ncbi:hypothetical protein B0H13DRAFT_1892035 [Mycena leptocephala]|nr:hypothetical protein B0H13DRAFT_1892035 [Mycena leptocephala]
MSHNKRDFLLAQEKWWERRSQLEELKELNTVREHCILTYKLQEVSREFKRLCKRIERLGAQFDSSWLCELDGHGCGLSYVSPSQSGNTGPMWGQLQINHQSISLRADFKITFSPDCACNSEQDSLFRIAYFKFLMPPGPLQSIQLNTASTQPSELWRIAYFKLLMPPEPLQSIQPNTAPTRPSELCAVSPSRTGNTGPVWEQLQINRQSVSLWADFKTRIFLLPGEVAQVKGYEKGLCIGSFPLSEPFIITARKWLRRKNTEGGKLKVWFEYQ